MFNELYPKMYSNHFGEHLPMFGDLVMLNKNVSSDKDYEKIKIPYKCEKIVAVTDIDGEVLFGDHRFFVVKNITRQFDILVTKDVYDKTCIIYTRDAVLISRAITREQIISPFQ